MAKIAVSKSSAEREVMGYRNRHNTRQIADELGISHVLEGSVRKTGAWLQHRRQRRRPLCHYSDFQMEGPQFQLLPDAE